MIGTYQICKKLQSSKQIEPEYDDPINKNHKDLLI